MEQQPLTLSVLKADRSVKIARFNATTIMMEMNIMYKRAKKKDVEICKMRDIENGFELTVPMKVNGEWKRCPAFRWTKMNGKATLEYDPRVITITI